MRGRTPDFLHEQKCAFKCIGASFIKKTKQQPVAAVMDAKRDGKSIFNIFLPQLKHAALSVNRIRLVFFILFKADQSSAWNARAHWAAPAKQREVGQRHFLQLAVDHFIYIYILKKGVLILLRNDWLKEEHQIKINSCPARLKGSFIVLALSCRLSCSVSKRGGLRAWVAYF